MATSAIAVELLDGEQGYAIQTWQFDAGTVVQVGRSRECEVVIASPVVSRCHACLRKNGPDYEVHALSSQGVFIEGQSSTHAVLANGTVFRLGRLGPAMRFRIDGMNDHCSENQTIAIDVDRTPVLVLNSSERDREVSELAQGEFFQELMRRNAALRGRTGTGTGRGSDRP